MERALMNQRAARGSLRISVVAIATAAILVASLAASTAQAGPHTAAHKFRRGVSNIGLGVLAIPGQMTHLSKEKGYAIGLPLGFVQGLGWMVVTEFVGMYELLSSPFEMPPEFRPMITPEYPWEYFEKRSTGAGLPKKRGTR